MSYPSDLSSELGRVGIRGRLRDRIVTEFADHLECDPRAPLGTPSEVAERFADELGTARARRAAMLSFAGLAVAGSLFAVAFLIASPDWARLHPPSHPAASLGAGLAALGSQVAFVAGVLAILRAWRRRDELVVPRAEATVIARRALVGVGAGIASMIGLALISIDAGRLLRGSAKTFALAAAGVGGLALLGTAPALASAVRIRPTRSGGAGDLFDDAGQLIPAALRGRPWRFALVVAALVAVGITLTGAVQSDGYDGALRGIADAAACLAGFGVLGRYLGLRS